jgi:DNA-binding protein HU-beta
MNKSELVASVRNKHKLKWQEARLAVNAVLDIIVNEISTGETGEVIITGFGKFERRLRVAHKAHNPYTGETFDVPDRNYVTFRPGAAFKRSVSSSSV